MEINVIIIDGNMEVIIHFSVNKKNIFITEDLRWQDVQKKSNIKYIQYAFPKDYKRLKSIITFQTEKVRLDTKNINDFCVHPEYDLPYKILSMYLSENERYNSINQLVYKKNNETNRRFKNIEDVDVDSSLYIHAKGNSNWNDYIFQISGIFDILGIKRNFKLVKHKEFKIQDIWEDGLEEIPVYKVIQNPILFLTLASIKLGEEDFCDENVSIILEKAISAFKEEKDSNEFDIVEQEICYQYLFEEIQGQKAFSAWRRYGEAMEIKEEMFSIVNNYWNEKSSEKDINQDIWEDGLEEIPVYKIIQNPILFLTLASIELDEEDFCDENVSIILKKAISAYNERKDSNEFDIVEQEICHQYLFEEIQGQKAFTAWRCNEETVEIKEKVFSIVKKYWDEMSGEKDIKEINFADKESEGISFPKYMRSIFVVLYENYDCLPLVRTEKESLWTTIKSFYLPNNIETVTGQSFLKILLYMRYLSDAKLDCDTFLDTYIIETNENDEQKYTMHLDIDEIEETLVRYYTFCLLILYRVSREKERYKNMAQDTFERIFSLYLFDFETELLCTKINEAEKSISEAENKSKIGLAEYIYINFSTEVIHAIYCSPGIYHRIRIAEYINQIDLSADILSILYENYDKNDMSQRTAGEYLIQRINEINEEYLYYEKFYIQTTLFKDEEELSIKKIEEKCEKDGHYEEYINFYKKIYDGIQEEIKEKIVKDETAFNKPTARKMAEKIIKNKSPEYKIVHFWVIFSSFLSKENSIVELES